MPDQKIIVQEATGWKDYALLDSGEGAKLERFGSYKFVRPEPQAIWKPALAKEDWEQASAVFNPSGEESGGHWHFREKVKAKWEMSYGDLHFWAMTTPGRHLGVFPESAIHWDWFRPLIRERSQSDLSSKSKITKQTDVQILNLFGYTGLATLVAAKEGARVTHVDASKKSVSWARSNQELSRLVSQPIRWIVDDALKFIQRESRRGVKYDGFIIEPPKFGRGPRGEVWEGLKSLPDLLSACQKCMSVAPLFVVITLYAVRASALHLAQVLEQMTAGWEGNLECGELALKEQSAGRMLSQAVYARWRGPS